MNEQLTLDIKCVHFWKIDCYNKGVCKKCGEPFDFKENNRKLDTEKGCRKIYADHLGGAEYVIQASLPSNVLLEYKI